ncbi:MAG: right-handed parallel beta-helix repeat-containing protein, partial [Clostridia bacterium]|nr:right-handed parallel beta-helix repeat-containing protein [Clostridia bacterium]
MTDSKNHLFYVSPSGSDNNPGTESHPFRTPERAQEEARKNAPAEVVFLAGCYCTSLHFTEADSGCTYRTAENALLTGGISISPESLVSPSDKIAARFSPDASEHIRAVDLASLGITREELGEIYPIGSYSSAGRYDNGKTGVNIEVFSGGRRMTNARYPNEGYLKIDHVLDQGEVNEYPSQNYWRENQKKRNPRGGTYLMDSATNERAKTWQNPDAWVFGYFYWDWADSSTPAELFTPNRAIFPRYVSLFGCRPGAPYYFYNILEELDAPGEFFLDREHLMLYVYPYSADDTIEMSLSTAPLISVSGAENLTIDGFTLTCVRSTAAVVNGNGCVLKNLTVRNATDHGITVTGNGNSVENCDISHTGRGGVYLTGGDRTTLTP